jgi:hypothetical protein
MFLFRRPSEQFIASTIEKNRDASFTYQNIGWTQSSKCPEGFAENLWSAVISEGKEGFEKAKLALRAYTMLQLGWIQHVGPCEPIETGSHVATLARESGIYSLNVARIVTLMMNRQTALDSATAHYLSIHCQAKKDSPSNLIRNLTRYATKSSHSHAPGHY